MNIVMRVIRHLWLDADDARRAVGEDTLQRLEARVHDSERRHTGEICLCIEASLPMSYLWRHLRRRMPIEQVVRERALTEFGKLRVWDTELNNGVLIYLQLAEHRIDIVADRGLARHVEDAYWRETLASMSAEFRAGRYEEGLTRAIDAVTAALERHFPASHSPGETPPQREDQLPNRPVFR
ncbi:TPM domain-containing protein [Aromatoleum aromaticum]|nr:TPM domain-containing protein [Aromatoleum aromaticum]NMG55914.1 TPM domain-containing protein [Aromatoleum aromaticum]